MVRCRLTIPIILAIVTLAQANVGQCQSSEVCRECHSDIFGLWKNSLHARSYENPTFRAAYMMVVLDWGEEIAQECLSCHAPVAYLAEDFNVKSVAAAEGVSCEFCHSIASVNPGKDISGYYNLDTTGVVYGPYQAKDTTGHRVQYSPLHLKAEVCVGCHEYVNDNGVTILGTFSEWKESPYARNNVYCQNCHMPIMIDLSVVDGQQVTDYYVTAHEFQGGHSKINLSHAVILKTEVEREDSRLNVKVHITNAESGHMLPTGIPIRRLVLTVTLKRASDVEVSSARKVYRKVLTDKYGTIIENVTEMFRRATSVYSDNRIRPQETRVEEFVFVVPKMLKDYKVEAVLNYEYTRSTLKEELVRIQMALNVIPSRVIK